MERDDAALRDVRAIQRRLLDMKTRLLDRTYAATQPDAEQLEQKRARLAEQYAEMVTGVRHMRAARHRHSQHDAVTTFSASSPQRTPLSLFAPPEPVSRRVRLVVHDASPPPLLLGRRGTPGSARRSASGGAPRRSVSPRQRGRAAASPTLTSASTATQRQVLYASPPAIALTRASPSPARGAAAAAAVAAETRDSAALRDLQQQLQERDTRERAILASLETIQKQLDTLREERVAERGDTAVGPHHPLPHNHHHHQHPTAAPTRIATPTRRVPLQRAGSERTEPATPLKNPPPPAERERSENAPGVASPTAPAALLVEDKDTAGTPGAHKGIHTAASATPLPHEESGGLGSVVESTGASSVAVGATAPVPAAVEGLAPANASVTTVRQASGNAGAGGAEPPPPPPPPQQQQTADAAAAAAATAVDEKDRRESSGQSTAAALPLGLLGDDSVGLMVKRVTSAPYPLVKEPPQAPGGNSGSSKDHGVPRKGSVGAAGSAAAAAAAAGGGDGAARVICLVPQQGGGDAGRGLVRTGSIEMRVAAPVREGDAVDDAGAGADIGGTPVAGGMHLPTVTLTVPDVVAPDASEAASSQVPTPAAAAGAQRAGLLATLSGTSRGADATPMPPAGGEAPSTDWAAEAEKLLASGAWRAKHDKTRNAYYYVNAVTKETCWDLQKHLKKAAKAFRTPGGVDTTGSAAMRTSSAGGSTAGAARDPAAEVARVLQEGLWVQKMDKESGKPYYQNKGDTRTTKKKVWDLQVLMQKVL